MRAGSSNSFEGGACSTLTVLVRRAVTCLNALSIVTIALTPIPCAALGAVHARLVIFCIITLVIWIEGRRLDIEILGLADTTVLVIDRTVLIQVTLVRKRDREVKLRPVGTLRRKTVACHSVAYRLRTR